MPDRWNHTTRPVVLGWHSCFTAYRYSGTLALLQQQSYSAVRVHKLPWIIFYFRDCVHEYISHICVCIIISIHNAFTLLFSSYTAVLRYLQVICTAVARFCLLLPSIGRIRYHTPRRIVKLGEWTAGTECWCTNTGGVGTISSKALRQPKPNGLYRWAVTAPYHLSTIHKIPHPPGPTGCSKTQNHILLLYTACCIYTRYILK